MPYKTFKPIQLPPDAMLTHVGKRHWVTQQRDQAQSNFEDFIDAARQRQRALALADRSNQQEVSELIDGICSAAVNLRVHWERWQQAEVSLAQMAQDERSLA